MLGKQETYSRSYTLEGGAEAASEVDVEQQLRLELRIAKSRQEPSLTEAHFDHLHLRTEPGRSNLSQIIHLDERVCAQPTSSLEKEMVAPPAILEVEPRNAGPLQGKLILTQHSTS